MQTRRGLCYELGGELSQKRRRDEEVLVGKAKRRKVVRRVAAKEEKWCVGGEGGEDLFDGLPDDIVLSILPKLSASASCPSDLISVLMTCKRLKGLLLHPQVLAKASPKAVAVKAPQWSEPAHRFLKQCADAGNLEACYMLGMIRFYCLQNRHGGAALLAKAAMGGHAAALYSLSVIQFNGSGGSKNDKNLHAGAALCARAASLGHIDALRELGHCLQDGYGVRQNVVQGRRYLVEANARELTTFAASLKLPHWLPHRHTAGAAGCPLLSDFGCNIPPPKVHAANQFLVDWFAAKCGNPEPVGGDCGSDGLRMCSHVGCGRPETRQHEFRRCSVCGTVNYCSRACQALDWKLRHKGECVPMERWRPEINGVDVFHLGEGVHDINGGDEGHIVVGN